MRRMSPLLRIAASIVILAALARILDVDLILARLGSLTPTWVALGLGLSLAQGLTLAWRWRFTAARLGIELPYRLALEEYYLGNFLNQVLPGGVVGDISRAWRHARTDAPSGSAVRAVIIERLSGQVVMTAVAVLSLAMLPIVVGGFDPLRGLGLIAVLAAVGLGLMRLASARTSRTSDVDQPASDPPPSLLGRFASDAHVAVLHREALPLQAATAIFVVGTYITIYLIGARAIHDTTPAALLAPLVAPVLMTMLLPVSVAGWGVREVAAAALWGAVGLTPEDGVAISVTYGLLVLVSTIPGALVLIGGLGRGRSRTEGHRPGDSAGPVDGAPHSNSESDPA